MLIEGVFSFYQQQQQMEAQKAMEEKQFQMAMIEKMEESKKMKAMMDSQKADKDHELEIEIEMNAFTLKASEMELKYDTDVPNSMV